jgi:small subunit ribosomal protein S20
MANTSSALKSIRQEEKRTQINRSRKSKIKTYTKKLLLTISNNSDKELVMEAFIKAQSEIMRGVTKKVLKLNNASRKISRLHKLVKALID